MADSPEPTAQSPVIEDQKGAVCPSLNSFDQVNLLCESFTKEWEQGRPDLASYVSQVPAEDRYSLLRNMLEFEIRRRRKNGETPTSKEYIERIPEFEAIIRRVFLDASSVSMVAMHEPTPSESLRLIVLLTR